MPESTTRLTPIQSLVLIQAARLTKANKSRLTLEDFTTYFRKHPKATAIPEAIYELLEQGLLAEYRDKRGGVIPKNYVVTDAGKDQASWEESNQDSPQNRKSRAKMTGSAKRKDQPQEVEPNDASHRDIDQEADEWDGPAKATPTNPAQRRAPAARPKAPARTTAKPAAKSKPKAKEPPQQPQPKNYTPITDGYDAP